MAELQFARVPLRIDVTIGPRKPRDDDADVETVRRALAERERELRDLKGPCPDERCRLHSAHSGPCDTAPAGSLT